MRHNKLLNKISKTAMIAAIIAIPISASHAFQDEDGGQQEEVVAPSPPTIKAVSLPPTAAVEEAVSADIDAGSTTDNVEGEPNADDEIDAELQAELERIERVEQFTNPDEFIKNIALKKPLIALPTPDAERLVVANQIVAQLFPVGTTERSMRENMDNLLLPMINRTLDLTVVEAIDLFGVPDDILGLKAGSEEEKEMTTKTIGDFLAEQEPQYREKMNIVFEAYAQITGLASEPIEPFLSEAMARDYARKYDLAQLNDLKTFFDTPTGSIFARDFMLSTASIDMVQTALKEFPAIAENSDKLQEVSKRLEEALKPSAKPEEDEATDEAAEESALGASDLGTEPWFQMENWDEETRDNVNLLQDTYNELAELSEQAYSQYDDAFEEAVAASRARYIEQGWTRDDK